jgi:RNA polymerase sigma-B factor
MTVHDLDDRELGRRARQGDDAARRELIERYVPLARAIAMRYRHTAEPLDDLIQVASLAVIQAVDRWDPSRGFAFTTFAVPTILGLLRRHFRDTTWMVRPPRRLLELSLVVEREREPLAAALGREPTVGELAAQVEAPADAVADALLAYQARLARSLDEPVTDDGEALDTVGGQLGHDDDGFERAEARTTVERLSSVLDDRARDVLRLRFEHDLRQSDIAALVGCSQMQVSRIIRASLDRLRLHATTGWGLTDTLEGATP